MEESDYKLIRQVGSGITGTVWAADGPSGRIAMRRFGSGAVQDSEEWVASRKHFLKGGGQSMTLRSPRIVSVLDVIDDGADAWIASEFVTHETLDALLRRDRLPVEQTTYMSRLIALALDYAHKAGVPHGDLKPSNIFVGEKRSVRVADFAISPRSLRKPGEAMDPAWVHPYLSPEHFISPASIGARTDQYALAAIAYHMYTGKAPFESVGGDPGPAILRGQVTPASSVNKNLPTAIDIPLLKAMSRDPSQRYSSCIEFIEHLEASLVPETAPPVAAATSPKLMYIGLASLLAALGIAGALMMLGGKGTKTEKSKTASTEVISPAVLPIKPPATPPGQKTARVKSQTGDPRPKPFEREQTEQKAATIPVSTPNDSYFRSTAARIANAPMDVVRRLDPPAPAPMPPAPVRVQAAPPSEQFGMVIPPEAPNGYSLVVFSRDPKHRIPNGIPFSSRDPILGEMGSGDLKAQILLKGPPGKGKLTLEWNVDGTFSDGRAVNPNTTTVFHNEPFPGNYHVVLRRDLTVVAEQTFRITP